jgi:hypothetical protein
MKTHAELARDPRVTRALDRLKRAGLNDVALRSLLEAVAQLPHRHERLMQETAPEAAKRRRDLAALMRELAQALDADPDAEFYPRYAGAEGEEPRQPVCADYRLRADELSLAAWLDMCSMHLEATHDPFRLVSRRGHENLKGFVVRGVAHFVGRAMGGGRARNVETALLASAILDEDVSPNDVTHANRDGRRRYANSEA